MAKVSNKVNKFGNKMKDKISTKINKAKKWFGKQSPFVKVLIKLVLIILAVLAIIAVIYYVIWPVLANIALGGAGNAIAGVFKLVGAGKTFHATYKQGKKSWESGEGWGKFFLLLIGSIFAVITIAGMAVQGRQMLNARSEKAAAAKLQQTQKQTNQNKSDVKQQTAKDSKSVDRLSRAQRRQVQQAQLFDDHARLEKAGITKMQFKGNTLMPEKGESASEYAQRFAKFKEAVGQKYGGKQIHSYLSKEGFKSARFASEMGKAMGNKEAPLPVLTDAQAEALKTPLPQPQFEFDQDEFAF